MGARSTAADLLAHWGTLTGEERQGFRVRTYNPTPLTFLVHDVREVEAESAMDEPRVEIRGYELSGQLAHLAGEQTAEGGTTQQVRVRIVGRRESVEILDLDEPNEPDGLVVDQEGTPVGLTPETIEQWVDVPAEVPDNDAPPGIEIDPEDHSWERALADAPAAGMPDASGVIDATGGWTSSTSSGTREVTVAARQGLYATSVPTEEWANTSQLRLPRPVLERLNALSKRRMIGRTILIAACIEHGLNHIEADNVI